MNGTLSRLLWLRSILKSNQIDDGVHGGNFLAHGKGIFWKFCEWIHLPSWVISFLLLKSLEILYLKIVNLISLLHIWVEESLRIDFGFQLLFVFLKLKIKMRRGLFRDYMSGTSNTSTLRDIEKTLLLQQLGKLDYKYDLVQYRGRGWK